MIGREGIVDDIAPGIGAESVDVFVLGDAEGLDHGLGEVGEGAGGARFDVALDDGDEEAAKGGVEIAGGEITAREEIGDVAAEFFGGLGLDFFAGVKIAEMRMA